MQNRENEIDLVAYRERRNEETVSFEDMLERLLPERLQSEKIKEFGIEDVRQEFLKRRSDCRLNRDASSVTPIDKENDSQ